MLAPGEIATPPTLRYACAYTHRSRPIALSIQWWGLRAMSVHVVWESAGQGRQKEEEEQRQQQATDLLCTYGCAAGRCVGASSHCSEGGREVELAAGRGHDGPFLLPGWGLHLAQSGINNPNHHIGPAHAVWTGRTPARRTVSLIPGRARESPVVPCSLDPYRAHVVARMLLLMASWACLCPSIRQALHI